jgi:hypothetical protein
MEAGPHAPPAPIDDCYKLGPLGSDGQVYVPPPPLGDEVAIKVMQSTEQAPPELRRFLRRPRLRLTRASSASDPGPTRGSSLMVMELDVDPGEIALGRPCRRRVWWIITAVAACNGHDQDHHRDPKPANIVLHRYESEAGLQGHRLRPAVMKSPADTADRPNLLGTMAYPAPEQIRGEPITAAADTYALGVIVYEMLTGVRPFDAEDRITLLNQVLTVRPVKPTERHADLPPPVDGVLMRALAKEPAERPSVPISPRHSKRRRASGQSPAAAPDSSLLARYELGAQTRT